MFNLCFFLLQVFQLDDNVHGEILEMDIYEAASYFILIYSISFQSYSELFFFIFFAGPQTENCAVINFNSPGLWDDTSCSIASYPYVCEMPSSRVFFFIKSTLDLYFLVFLQLEIAFALILYFYTVDTYMGKLCS